MTFPSMPPLMPPNIKQAAPTLSKIALEGIRLRMDEYAREIFDLWFSGKAPPVVIFDNEKWATYMRAEPRVRQQVFPKLQMHAKSLQSAARWSASIPTFSFFELPPFHLEVGSESGGYFVGYNVLHGTDKDAGDFKVSGKYRVGPVPGPVRAAPGAFSVTYDDLQFEFCDMVDINSKWKSDELAGVLAQAMAGSLGGPQPKDYELHVKWRHGAPIPITIDPTFSWLP